jgi:hypothetical protein
MGGLYSQVNCMDMAREKPEGAIKWSLRRMNELKVNAGNRQHDHELEVGHTGREKIQGLRVITSCILSSSSSCVQILNMWLYSSNRVSVRAKKRWNCTF